MTTEELKELLTLLINRGSDTLDASAIETTDGKAVLGIEHAPSGDLFFLEIQEA